MATNIEGTNIPFNRDIDLITERETVYDFISRLKFGKTVTNIHNTSVELFPAGVFVKDVIRRMIMLFPHTMAVNIKDIKVSHVEIPVNATTVNISAGVNLLRVISERTGKDIKDCFTPVSSSGAVVTYQMITDVGYLNPDVLTVYYK